MITIYEGLADIKCDLCDNPTKWMVFGWDGKPKLSRLLSLVCKEHVGYQVRYLRQKEQLKNDIKKPFLNTKDMIL
jgi:hypothetical protein